MASLQSLTPRAFQSAKSSLRLKWGCDCATNHSDSRTVIATRRAALARWKLTSSSEGGGTVALRATNRPFTLKTRVIPIFPCNNQCRLPHETVKSQQLWKDVQFWWLLNHPELLQPSRLPVVMDPLWLQCNTVQNTIECIKILIEDWAERQRYAEGWGGGHSDLSACLWLNLSLFSLVLFCFVLPYCLTLNKYDVTFT